MKKLSKEQFINKCIKTHGNRYSYNELKIRDEIKNKYCRDVGIPLIRIPYWELNNIEKILIEEKII